MRTTFINYILQVPGFRIKVLSLLSIVLFFIFFIFQDRLHFGLETTFIFITLNIWMGGSLTFVWYFAKFLTVMQKKDPTHKVLFILGIIFQIVLFAGPVFCYIMAKYYQSTI
jgi:hypothetical protein